MIAAPVMALLAACGGGAGDAPAAEGDPPAEIKVRQDNFEAIGDSFKLIRNELELENPDFLALQAAATDINDRAARLDGYFPSGSGRAEDWDTEALAAIWEKPEEFTAAQQKLIEESGRMVEIVKGGDAAAVGEQVKALGASCKNCHDTFRLDDE
ncbi:cytochrome c [Erythrobacter sp. JK5]|uniref:c-type cytochrome n=1 Tax=Erythrobacter sp. JK5 TaxID=2829500 RepID=UPI001BA606D5|nr:cytochrome c [Erythrobacter sp. JK5]QUL38305.1 cytochrome c [Erythrobacter sp. JK5]